VKEAVLLRKHSVHDLAILYTIERNLPTARLGDSDKVEVGQDVVAIGNPRGLENTISPGIISGIRSFRGLRYLQTTAPISSGSSGGPLLNMKGEVVGLTVFTVRDSQNLNFAIPVNEVRVALGAARNELKVVMQQLAKARAEEEADRHRVAEEERRRRAAELDAAKKAAEEEARRRAAEAEAAKRAAEEEARRRAARAEAARKAAEDEAKERAAALAAAQQARDEAARRKATEAAAGRVREDNVRPKEAELAVARALVSEELRRRAASLPSLFPEPDMPLAVTPLALGLVRPSLEPPSPPPPAAPTVELRVPLPVNFESEAGKPMPLVRDPGGMSCTFAFGRAGTLADCGVHRFLQGDLSGAREAFEDSVDREPRSVRAGVAYAWLGEVAFHARRYDEAERRYRSAVALALPPDLAAHAWLGLAWTALRRGDPGEAQRAQVRAVAGTPPPAVVLFARFLDGVVRLQAGRPQEALAQWDAVAAAGPPSQLAEELGFWRGAALAQLRQADPALRALDGFLGATSVTHPLRPDAVVQSGWVALLRGAPDEALRRLLWTQGSSLRPELIPQLRAGLVRAYLAVGDLARARDVARALKGESPRDPLVPAVLLLLADDASRRNATAEAVDLYRELIGVALDPAYGEYAMYRLAEGLERLGSLTDAEKSYRALRDGGRVEALAQRAAYRLGVLALRAQRPGDARAEGEMLLRAVVVPELREAAILLAAESAARADDANRAAALFRLALREYPASARAGAVRLALGWALLKDREPELALREWHEAALANEVEVAVQANLAIAQVALQQGREPESLTALRQVTVLAPRHPLSDVLALNRGLLLVRAKDHAGAVQELQPLTRIVQPFRLSAPAGIVVDLEPILRRALGIARYHLAQFDLSEREFERARQFAPAEPSHYLGEGLAALAQDRFDQAEQALTTAGLASSPDLSIPAKYASVLLAARRGNEVLFHARAASFISHYPSHPYSGRLASALRLQTSN
jgi:tetratricopeptide (TPR) repeat protein